MKNYFKKISIMFVMLLAILGIGIIQNGSVANAATVGSQLTAPESGWTRYEDTNKNISYVGGWSPWKGSANIWTNSTAYYSNNINSVCKFNFTGDKIRIIIELSSDHTTNVNVKIDGINYGVFSERNKVQKGKILIYEKTGLSKEEHSIVLTNMVKYQFVIDAIDIDSSGELKPYSEINESISLDKSSMDMTTGESETLMATTTPSGVSVTWSSSDTSVATVDSNGTVTAIGVGTAIITATTTDGSNLSDSCTVNVTEEDTAEPTNPTDSNIGAILIINLTDGETKVFDVSSSEADEFKSWYNTKTEYESQITYEFDKTVNSSISIEEDVVHDQITSYEIRK